MPLLWDNTVNYAFKKKEEIQTMQNSRADSIKSEIDKFAIKVKSFRSTFMRNAPFTFTGKVEKAYKSMDEQQQKLSSMESEAAKYHELEELFELPVKKYTEIEDTQNDWSS